MFHPERLINLEPRLMISLFWTLRNIIGAETLNTIWCVVAKNIQWISHCYPLFLTVKDRWYYRRGLRWIFCPRFIWNELIFDCFLVVQRCRTEVWRLCSAASIWQCTTHRPINATSLSLKCCLRAQWYQDPGSLDATLHSLSTHCNG